MNQSPEIYVALTNLTINATGETIEKGSQIPSGIAGFDYQNALGKWYITTLDQFQQFGFVCNHCSP